MLRDIGTVGEKVMLHLASNDISILEADFAGKILDVSKLKPLNLLIPVPAKLT